MSHPVQTVGATEELLDQLVICQARDVSGADGDLRLPSNSHGFVGGGEGFLSNWCHLLLTHVGEIFEPSVFPLYM